MAVTDNRNNSQSECSDRKSCRKEENPETCASPELDSTKKGKKIRRKKKTKESDEKPQVQVCPNPLLDTAIPIIPQNEKTETTAHNPVEKKHVQEAQQLQTCNPSIPIDVRKEKEAQLDDVNGNGDLYLKREPAVPEKEKGGVPDEFTVENPVPDPTPPHDTPREKRWRKKKKNVVESQRVEPEPKKSNNIEHSHQSSPVDSELVNKMKEETEPEEGNAEHIRVSPQLELTPLLDIAVPKGSGLEKSEEPTKSNVEHPLVCSKSESAPPVNLATPMNPEKKKEVELTEAHEQHPQPVTCTKQNSQPPGDLTATIDPSRGKPKNKKGKERKMCLEEKAENQSDPVIAIYPKPESLSDITIPIGPAIPMDTEQKMEKKKRKRQRKNVLEPNEPVMEQAETQIQTPTCLVAAPPIDQTTPMDPHPAIPISPAISMDPQPVACTKVDLPPAGDLTAPIDLSGGKLKNKKGKERRMCLEENTENQSDPAISLCPKPESLIDKAVPVDPAILMDMERKTEKKKRKMQRRNVLEPNEPVMEQAETPIQKPVACTKLDSQAVIDLTTPIDPSGGKPKSKKGKERKMCLEENAKNQSDPAIPLRQKLESLTDKTIPNDPAILMDTEQKMEKKKRKRQRTNALDVVEPNEIVMEQAETLIQTPTCRIAAPPIDKTIPVDPLPAIPISPTISMDLQPVACTKLDSQPAGVLTTPIDPSGGKPKKKKGKERKMCLAENAENQSDPAIPLCPKPESLTDKTIPIDPANPMDTEPKMEKKKRKRQRKNVLEHNGPVMEQEETPIQTPTCLIAAPPIEQTIPVDPCPAIPISPTISMDPRPVPCTKLDSQPVGDPTTSIDPSGGKPKSKKGKERKMCLEENAENQSDPAIPLCPKPESLTDKTIPIDPAIPMDTEQKMEKKKRKRQRKNMLDVVEPNGPVMEHVETPIQTPTCVIAAPPIGQTIPMDPLPAIPISPTISMDLQPVACTKLDSQPTGDLTTPIDPSGGKPKNRKGKDRKMCLEMNAENQSDPAIPLCPKPESLTDKTIPIDPAIPMDTEQKMEKKKRKRQKKNVLDVVEPKGPVMELAETPIQTPTCLIAALPIEQTIPVDPCPAIPISPTISIDPQPVACTKLDSQPVGDLATPIDPSGGKPKSKKGKERKMCLEQNTGNQSDPAIPLCPKPESLTDKTIPIDSATLMDTEQKMEKKKRKRQRKNVLDVVEPNGPVVEQAETPIETPTYLIAAPPIDATIPMDPHPSIPISPALSTDPEQNMSKKKWKKKRKSALKIEGEEPIEHNDKPPDAPDQNFIYPVAAPSVDPIIPIDQAFPVDAATPIDQHQKMTREKRKKKNRIVLVSEGADLNEHYAKAPETPVQGSVYPIAAPSTDTTVLTGPAPPIDAATPIGQGQEMTQKKRKKKRQSALTSQEVEPNEHECEPPETPVQQSTHPTSAPSMGPIVPISQAPPADPVTPVETEQMMTKEKKCEMKNEELESKKHNTDPTAETLVQGTEGPSAVKVSSSGACENSMSKYNAERAGTVQVLIRDSPIASPKDKSSVICQACRHLGHDIQHCQKLKHLSMDEEVCFFCGEIGHSLGKCSVTQAKGGMFAKCLFCYGHGHFSYNCPRNGQGFVPMVCHELSSIKKDHRRKRKNVAY